MGFMDKLKELTQPYDDDEDFFEGADPSFKPQPKAKPEAPASKPAVSQAQKFFESSFADDTPLPAEDPTQKPAAQEAPGGGGGIFGNLGIKKAAKPRTQRERLVNFGGSETQVILFNPKTFEEAGELVNHLNQSRSVVMTLEGVPNGNARRLLDFLSGVTFALQRKITPISAKTYFVSPQNVDLLNSQSEQPVSDEQYF